MNVAARVVPVNFFSTDLSLSRVRKIASPTLDTYPATCYMLGLHSTEVTSPSRVVGAVMR